MERPQIKDKKILEYIEQLEKELDNYKSDRSIVHSYLGIKNIVDQSNKVLRQVSFDPDDLLEPEDGDEKDIKYQDKIKKIRRNQKLVERVGEMNDRLIKTYPEMLKLEKIVNQKMLKEEEGKPSQPDSILERALNEPQ